MACGTPRLTLLVSGDLGVDGQARVPAVARQDHRRSTKEGKMTEPAMQDLRDHFAHCVQVLGGVTTSSRRLGIDERAIRRFVSGELPVRTGLMEDVAKALRALVAEATAAEEQIATIAPSQQDKP
jgi:hypothetical protein